MGRWYVFDVADRDWIEDRVELDAAYYPTLRDAEEECARLYLAYSFVGYKEEDDGETEIPGHEDKITREAQ